MDKIKVLMVEDHQMTRMGTSLALEKSGLIDLVGEAMDGKTGVECAKKLDADVILMDIGLPVMDGIEATQKIKDLNIASKVLVFTSRDNNEDVFAALKAGADGYIMKGATPETLINAICAVNEGAGWLDPGIARLVLSNVQAQKEEETVQKAPVNKYNLTPRELEVLSLMVEGMTNPQISEQLVVSISTTKAHVHSILQKLYISHRAKAAAFAVKEGLV